jgi:hypothetical protein
MSGEIDTMIAAAAARALRRRAAAQRGIASAGTVLPDTHPGVLVASGRGEVEMTHGWRSKPVVQELQEFRPADFRLVVE